MVVDDYTSKFAIYSAERMVDIEGYNKDTACVVTNNRAITCFNGVAGLPDPNFIIKGNINSIGRNNFPYGYNLYPGFLIATDSAGYYDYDFSAIQAHAPGYGRIYESSYRRLMLRDDYALNFDPLNTINVDFLDNVYYDISNIWKGGQYGKDPYTAFYTTQGLGIGYAGCLF